MKLSESVKPISYVKKNTAEALRHVSENQRLMVITQHGEAKAVLQDIASYEQTQKSLALLKMLAQSVKSIQEGRSKPLKKAFAEVRKRTRRLRLKRYRVQLVEDAKQDLLDIYRYIALRDSVDNADYVLDQLESLCSQLDGLPERGLIR